MVDYRIYAPLGLDELNGTATVRESPLLKSLFAIKGCSYTEVMLILNEQSRFKEHFNNYEGETITVVASVHSLKMKHMMHPIFYIVPSIRKISIYLASGRLYGSGRNMDFRLCHGKRWSCLLQYCWWRHPLTLPNMAYHLSAITTSSIIVPYRVFQYP